MNKKILTLVIGLSVLFPLAAFAQTGGPSFDESDSSSYGGGNVTICYRNETITVSAQQAERYFERGATAGACRPPGTLIVIKNTTGGDGTFRFTSENDLVHHFSITTQNGTGSTTLTLPPGTYTISERTSNHWTMTSNTCKRVVITSGATSTCTVTNIKSRHGNISDDVNFNGGDDSDSGNLFGGQWWNRS